MVATETFVVTTLAGGLMAMAKHVRRYVQLFPLYVVLGLGVAGLAELLRQFGKVNGTWVVKLRLASCAWLFVAKSEAIVI